MVKDTTSSSLPSSKANGASPTSGVIPNDKSRKFRTLIICYDGTGDQEDKDVTNVIELRDMLHGWDKKSKKGNVDPEVQQVYYKPGIGTSNPLIPWAGDMKIPVITNASRTVDQAVAWSMSYHVIDGYKWIAERYREGDRICIFGFSRGSYTARVLAGMLSKVGLLPADAAAKKDVLNAAFESYEQHGSNIAWAQSAKFRRANKCRNVLVQFLGCWDTVNSVGLVTSKRLPFTSENGIVVTFRHAIALDEHRARFNMNMWGGTEDDIIDPDQDKEGKDGWFSWVSNWWYGTGDDQEQFSESDIGPPITVVTDEDEVWFAGAHCDIGGGSVPNNTRPNLAHIPLRWMIRECFKTESGIIFREENLRSFGLDPKILYPVVQPRPPALDVESDKRVQKVVPPGVLKSTGSFLWNLLPEIGSKKVEAVPKPIVLVPGIEEKLDSVDALAPIYDQLEQKAWKWSLMEYHRMKVWSKKDKAFIRKQNNFQGRRIPLPVNDEKDKRLGKIRVHRTVKTRMETPMVDGSTYVPKALVSGKEGYTLDKALNLVDWVE
ncbi:hypothetical protein BDQ17DRAFT_1350615 [Cyathus striatus]|nr:hypothetical protein BDQ17DRAFT_1350615 [Cyathus striatus]